MLVNVASFAALLMAATTVSAMDGFLFLNSTSCDGTSKPVTKIPNVPIEKCLTFRPDGSLAIGDDPNNGVRETIGSFEFVGVESVCPGGRSPNAYIYADSLTCSGNFTFSQPFIAGTQNICMSTGSEYRSIVFVCCKGDPSVPSNCVIQG